MNVVLIPCFCATPSAIGNQLPHPHSELHLSFIRHIATYTIVYFSSKILALFYVVNGNLALQFHRTYSRQESTKYYSSGKMVQCNQSCAPFLKLEPNKDFSFVNVMPNDPPCYSTSTASRICRTTVLIAPANNSFQPVISRQSNKRKTKPYNLPCPQS